MKNINKIKGVCDANLEGEEMLAEAAFFLCRMAVGKCCTLDALLRIVSEMYWLAYSGELVSPEKRFSYFKHVDELTLLELSSEESASTHLPPCHSFCSPNGDHT